jgi:hypothetical protein
LVNVTQLGVIASSTWRGSFIGVPFGGTGSSTLSSNQVLIGNGASPIGVVSGYGSSGQFLTSNGSGIAPTWTTSSINLANFYAWTGLHTFNGLSVGIGTTTASTTLSVGGNALVSGTTTTGNLLATSTLQVGGTGLTSLTYFLAASTTLVTTTVSSANYVPIATTTASLPVSGNVMVSVIFAANNNTASDGCQATLFIDNTDKALAASGLSTFVATASQDQNLNFTYTAIALSSGVHYFTLQAKAVVGGTCTTRFTQMSLTYLGQ